MFDESVLSDALPPEMLALLQPPSLEGLRRVLCVQPHPDDNEIGMGGTIAHLVEQGCAVDYLTVTDGRLGDMGCGLSPEELAVARRVEAETAGRMLGVDKFLFLDHADGSLSDVPSLAREIAEVVRAGGYDAVFAPDPWSPYEAHEDHTVCGRAMAQAAISVNLAHYPENTDTAPCELTAVGFYFTARPNTTVDVSAHHDRKMQAIAAHRTQVDGQLLAVYDAYFKLRGARLSGGVGIAEGLKLLRPLHLHCFPEAAEL